MHITLLGESHAHVFALEHEERIREGNRQRLLAAARAAVKRTPVTTESPRRGFIPRVAGALGLL